MPIPFTISDEKFEWLIIKSLANIEESARVHEMHVMPLLTEAIAMRLDIKAHNEAQEAVGDD